MSVKTWKAKFYSEFDAATMTKEAALRHSLKKWQGALAQNCEKYGVEYGKLAIFDHDGYTFEFGPEDCALCQKYYKGGISKAPSCTGCPILPKGEISGCHGRAGDPWYESFNDPLPMYCVLNEALKKLVAAKKKKAAK